MAERIMITSGKGGVGKSTVCLGVAAGLAAMGKRALILEADTGFRGLDISLSVQDKALYDLADLLEGRSTLGETLLRHSRTGVELICAPNDPEYLPNTNKLYRLLDELDERCDYLLIDCGAGFGPLQGRLAQRSNLAIIVTVPEQTAVRAAARTSLLLHKKGLSNQRLVINRIPRRLPEDAVIGDLDDVINLVGAQLIGAVPEGAVAGGMPRREDGLSAEELYRVAERLCGKQAELVIYR